MGGEIAQNSDEEDALLLNPDGQQFRLLFIRVPEGKSAKNRVHFDLTPGDNMAAEVERLLKIGATKLRAFNDENGTFTVMQDPEGNEFCVERSLQEKNQN